MSLIGCHTFTQGLSKQEEGVLNKPDEQSDAIDAACDSTHGTYHSTCHAEVHAIQHEVHAIQHEVMQYKVRHR